ncbi:MAG: hypothetical protein M3139_07965 [Bacteroidota bacterium]|nr:hypothetical protein [Bacteroidota bacterium]
MKIEQALVLYLLKHKQLSLQRIGTFNIDGAIPDNADSDKPFIIPPDAISFKYDVKTGEDQDLIDFIVQNTKKIKPLASADLDSFLTLGLQFLNIGKPFTIQNLGTLEKAKAGGLEFKPGPLIQRVEAPKVKIEDEGAEKHEENLFNDYQRKPEGNGKMILIIAIILIVGIGAWAAWHYAFKQKDNEVVTTSDAIIPVTDSISIRKNDSIKAAKILTDSVSAAQNKAGDSITFKVVVKETNNKAVALARTEILKSYGKNIVMYTADSITFKVAQIFTAPPSDTAKILDSLNRYYYRGKAYIDLH